MTTQQENYIESQLERYRGILENEASDNVQNELEREITNADYSLTEKQETAIRERLERQEQKYIDKQVKKYRTELIAEIE